MNSLFLGTLTFLVVLPAISICDEDLSKASETAPININKEDAVVKYSNQLEAEDDVEYDYMNEKNLPWSFYRQLRSPSGFSAVRGKKAYDPENYWQTDVIFFCIKFKFN